MSPFVVFRQEMMMMVHTVYSKEIHYEWGRDNENNTQKNNMRPYSCVFFVCLLLFITFYYCLLLLVVLLDCFCLCTLSV